MVNKMKVKELKNMLDLLSCTRVDIDVNELQGNQFYKHYTDTADFFGDESIDELELYDGKSVDIGAMDDGTVIISIWIIN